MKLIGNPYYLVVLGSIFLLTACSSSPKSQYQATCAFHTTTRDVILKLEYSDFMEKWKHVPIGSNSIGFWKIASEKVPLEYPLDANINGYTGYVVSLVYVDSTGCIKDFTIVQSCPLKVFHESTKKYLPGVCYSSNDTVNHPIRPLLALQTTNFEKER